MHSLFTIRASKKPIDCVKFISTTKFLTSQDDGEIFIHDLQTRRQMENYKPREELILNFDCDRNNLICNYRNYGFSMFDISRECSLLFSHERSNPTYCNVSFDGSSPSNLIGPDNICKNVMLFDVRSRDCCIYECPDHGRLMTCRPIGDKLVLGGFEDGHIVVWAREKLQPLFEQKISSLPVVTLSQVVGNVFVCGTFEPYLRVLRLLDNSAEKILEHGIDSLVLSCVATNKDMVSVGGSSYGKIYLISNSGVTKCRINGEAINAIDTCDDKADLRMLVECGTQLSKNYDYLFACGESDGSVSFWSTAEIS